MHDATILSSRLLELETIAQAGPLTQEQRARWHELLVQWIELRRHGDERRRFLRFDQDTEVRLRAGDAVHVVKLTEIANFGLQIRGKLGKAFRKGEQVTWEAISVGGRWIDIGARGAVVRKQGSTKAGIALESGDRSAMQRIYDNVYYPAYVQTLAKMASAAPANA